MLRTVACAGSRPIARRRTRASGFTLVELAVVVALVALFTIITIPLFGSAGTSKLDYSARRLSGTIKHLYNESALTGLEHRLIFNLDRDSYRAKVVEASGEVVDLQGTGSNNRLAGDVHIIDLQLPERGLFTAGEVTIHIYPTGWVDENSVHLENEDGDKLTLRVMPLTGTSEILEGYKSL